MLDVTATHFARNLSDLLDQVEKKKLSIRILRNHKPVATLTPQIPPQNALQAFGDLYRPLEHTIDDDWWADIERADKAIDARLATADSKTARDPWR